MQANASTRALAPTLWPAGVVGSVILVVAGTAVLTLAAKTSVPFWPVPLTLQSLAVMLIAATYGSRLAVATVLAYIAEGLVGLPVFAGPAAGAAYLLGPTGGFIWGFVVMAAIIGFAADRGDSRSTPKLFLAILLGEAAMFALGLIHLGAAVPKLGYSSALLAAGLYPFVLGDLLKIVLVALAVPAGWQLLGRKDA